MKYGVLIQTNQLHSLAIFDDRRSAWNAKGIIENNGLFLHQIQDRIDGCEMIHIKDYQPGEGTYVQSEKVEYRYINKSRTFLKHYTTPVQEVISIINPTLPVRI